MTELEIVVRGLPANVNETRRRHWSSVAKDAASWRRTAKLSAIGALRMNGHADRFPLAPALVEFEFLLPAARGDLDNLVAASKPLLDGLVDAGVLVDDSVKWTTMLVARWRRSSEAGVVIRIKEAP